MNNIIFNAASPIGIDSSAMNKTKRTCIKVKGSVRDDPSLKQLVILNNLESLDSMFVRQEHTAPERLMHLNEIAITQTRTLDATPNLKNLKA